MRPDPLTVRPLAAVPGPVVPAPLAAGRPNIEIGACSHCHSRQAA